MQRLREGARALGLELTDRQQAAFQLYYEELVAWNQKFNLTAIVGFEQIQIRHFLDSLSCLLAGETRLALLCGAEALHSVPRGRCAPPCC